MGEVLNPMPRALHSLCWAGVLGADRGRNLSRGKLIIVVRWVVTLLAFCLVLRSIDLGAVVGAIRRAALTGLGLAALVIAAQFVVLVWRWQMVMRIIGGSSVGFGSLSLVLGQSLLIGQVLPSSLGGDVARTVMLARLSSGAGAARSVICDRALGFASLVLLAIPVLPVLAYDISGLRPIFARTVATLGTVIIVGLMFSVLWLPFSIPWLGRHLAVIADDLRNSFSSLRAVGLALASNLLGVLLIYLLGSAIGAGLQALDCLILVPPALLISALPISLGGWGVREGALVAAFSLVQADPAGVAAVSVMFGLTTPLAGGVIAAASFVAGWGDPLSRQARDG
jgi:glycosyltransferase 2 family protein